MNNKKLDRLWDIATSSGIAFILVIAIPFIQVITAFIFQNVEDDNLKLFYNLILSAGVLITALIYLIVKDDISGYFDYKWNKEKFEFLFDVFLKNVHISEETIIFSIEALPKNSSNVDSKTKITRILHVVNLNNSIIDHIYLPWFYSIYHDDHMSRKNYIVKSIDIHYTKLNGLKDVESKNIEKDGDDLSPTINQNIIVKYPSKDPNKPDETEANGWIRAPIFLRPNTEKEITIIYNQDHIFDKLFKKEGESAGTVIAIPTKKLNIIVDIKDYEGKERKIVPVSLDKRDSILIMNKSLNLKDKKEICQASLPEYNDRQAIWTIDKPKVGFLYQMFFKIEEEEEKTISSPNEHF